MSNENNKPTEKPADNRSAAQKLKDLEQAVGHLFNTNDHIVKDLQLLKNAIKLLNNKVDAIVKASTAGEEITDAVLDRIMIENNVADLANKVTNMVVQGVVAPEEQVSENSFVVGCEVEDNGTVTNPRIQFALKALQPDLQPKLVGLKPGDSVKFKDGELSFKLLESYKIQELPTEATPETTDETPVTPTEAAQPDATPTAG